MCWLCVGGYRSCQDCGSLICFDVEADEGDDILRPAYVTDAGDLFCNRCGRRHDEADDDAEEATL